MPAELGPAGRPHGALHLREHRGLGLERRLRRPHLPAHCRSGISAGISHPLRLLRGRLAAHVTLARGAAARPWRRRARARRASSRCVTWSPTWPLDPAVLPGVPRDAARRRARRTLRSSRARRGRSSRSSRVRSRPTTSRTAAAHDTPLGSYARHLPRRRGRARRAAARPRRPARRLGHAAPDARGRASMLRGTGRAARGRSPGAHQQPPVSSARPMPPAGARSRCPERSDALTARRDVARSTLKAAARGTRRAAGNTAPRAPVAGRARAPARHSRAAAAGSARAPRSRKSSSPPPSWRLVLKSITQRVPAASTKERSMTTLRSRPAHHPGERRARCAPRDAARSSIHRPRSSRACA